jgi:formate C-acetyltransferase
MNDAVNMAALSRYGYEIEDIRNYTMVGCIENFITGMQPPWTDGRFDTPRFLEYVLNDGKGFIGNHCGIDTDSVDSITSMDELMRRLENQIAHGVKAYIDGFYAANYVEHPEQLTQPFLSCFCQCCIERGLDINMGGSKYPSVHGAGLMGVGTLSDSLAAIEKVVFLDQQATLAELVEALRHNFEGYAELQKKLLAAPKYGNNDDFVDKYAVWFTDYVSDCFDQYKTRDGGGIYTAMAANISNIYAGMGLGASPDGRFAGQPLSDAASPSYGKDTGGITSTLLSVSKPDYSRCACGTVINQKLSPSVFEDGNREKLLRAIRVYFARGGQELQINATSPEVLRDAMEHPENYRNLVVRVSGFSATYIYLAKEVQMDILSRTQHE